MNPGSVIGSRLLLAAAGPFRIALEMDRIEALLPASARLVPVDVLPWVLGRVRFRGEDIPWISLCCKLGFERRGAAPRGFVFPLAGSNVAVEIDEVIGVTPGTGDRLLPLPPGACLLGGENLPGLVVGEFGEAWLLRLDGLFGMEEVASMGRALYA